MLSINQKTVLLKYFTEDKINKFLSKWNEPHRYYHNIDHLNNLLEKIDILFSNFELNDDYDIFILSALFHDIIYNPRSSRNEDDSIDYFLKNSNKIPTSILSRVTEFINSTKYRQKLDDNYLSLFWEMDNDILINGSISELIEYEHKIFKEFQFVDYNTYKEKRIEFLRKEEYLNENISFLISYIKSRKIKVGIYCGSFNPFHIGHMDVLQKSSLIFDKVILSYGNNPEKDLKMINTPKSLLYYQIDKYDGLVTDYITKLENDGLDVTLVRGLRNGADLAYESNQLSFINDIKPGVKVIFIPCDKKYEHISSSAIRNLEKFDSNLAKKYIVI